MMKKIFFIVSTLIRLLRMGRVLSVANGIAALTSSKGVKSEELSKYIIFYFIFILYLIFIVVFLYFYSILIAYLPYYFEVRTLASIKFFSIIKKEIIYFFNLDIETLVDNDTVRSWVFQELFNSDLYINGILEEEKTSFLENLLKVFQSTPVKVVGAVSIPVIGCFVPPIAAGLVPFYLYVCLGLTSYEVFSSSLLSSSFTVYNYGNTLFVLMVENQMFPDPRIISERSAINIMYGREIFLHQKDVLFEMKKNFISTMNKIFYERYNKMSLDFQNFLGFSYLNGDNSTYGDYLYKKYHLFENPLDFITCRDFFHKYLPYILYDYGHYNGYKDGISHVNMNDDSFEKAFHFYMPYICVEIGHKPDFYKILEIDWRRFIYGKNANISLIFKEHIQRARIRASRGVYIRRLRLFDWKTRDCFILTFVYDVAKGTISGPFHLIPPHIESIFNWPIDPDQRAYSRLTNFDRLPNENRLTDLFEFNKDPCQSEKYFLDWSYKQYNNVETRIIGWRDFD